MAGGGGGSRSLTAAAGPGRGATGGGIPAGRQELRRSLPAVRAGEQLGDGGTGSQQRRGRDSWDAWGTRCGRTPVDYRVNRV